MRHSITAAYEAPERPEKSIGEKNGSGTIKSNGNYELAGKRRIYNVSVYPYKCIYSLLAKLWFLGERR